MIQNTKCCACALRRERRWWKDQEDKPAYISLKGQTCTEMEWACLSRGWALNPQVLLLEMGIRHKYLFSLLLKRLEISWDLSYTSYWNARKLCCRCTYRQQGMKPYPAFMPHSSSVELFQFIEKGQMSRTPEILMKYLSHSTSAAVAAWEFTNSGQSSTPTLLLAGPWVFLYRSHYCFQLNDKWES